MQGIGASVDTVLDELFNAEIVGRLLAFDKVLALQYKINDGIAGAGIEEVGMLGVVQLQVVAGELQVDAWLSFRKEGRVQLNGAKEAAAHATQTGLELVLRLGKDLLLAGYGLQRHLDLEYLRIPIEHFGRRMDLDEVHPLHLVVLQLQAFALQVGLEDLTLPSMLLHLVLAIVGQHEVHTPLAIIEASVGLSK